MADFFKKLSVDEELTAGRELLRKRAESGTPLMGSSFGGDGIKAPDAGSIGGNIGTGSISGAIAGATAGVKKPSNGISINDIFKPKTQNTGALATVKMPDVGIDIQSDPDMDDYLAQITAKADKANAKNDNAALARANLAYTGEKGIAGIGKSVQDFINQITNMGTILMRNQQAQDANSIAAFGALTGNDKLIDTAVRQQQEAQQPLDLKPAVNFGTRFTQQVEEKYAGKISDAGEVGGEISSAIGYMVPSIVTNLVTRGLGAAANPGLYTMATSAAGGATEEALAAGADDERAIMYGTAVGLTSALTEKLTGGLQIFGKGTLDDAIEGTAKKLLKNESAQYAAMKLWGLLGEGVEEFAEELAGRLHSELFVDLGSDTHMDDRGVAETFGDAGRSFVMGVIVSGILQTGLNIMSPTETTDRKALAQKAADAINEDVDKQVALHKLAQENNGELQVMVESIILSRDYAEGSESRKLGGELETALYNLIRSGDSAGVRQFFKANRQLFAQLSRSLEQEAESARPADAAQRVNENLLQHSRDNAHVMEEGESRAFDALVAQGMTNAEAIEVAEIVERIVSGDDTLSNNEIIKAGVTKDKRVRAAINALTGSELDTSKQNMKPSEAKPLMRDIIDRIKAQKQAEAAAVENAAIEGSAQIDVAEMVAETAAASATAENADAAAKFISLAKPAAEAEIKPQSGSVKSEGYVIDEEEIRAVGREEGFADKEIEAMVDEFEAMAREAGIDAEENPDAFINYSVAQENESGIKVDGYRPGVITAEQQLTTDILKVALADLGVKDVVLVTGSPSMLGTNGRYENGTVYVNADRINTQTYNGIAWVVGHEITHAAERAGVDLKRNGETVANAPIVNDILEVMADMAKDGAITGTYARAALDSDAMQSLIERKKTAQHRFYMKDKVRADGSIIKGMSKKQAEKAFNDFDAKAEIAADFLGTLMGSNMLHESDGRLGSKYGPADLLSMMDEKKPGLLQQIRDFVIELRDKVMGQTPKTAAERKAKANTQRHLTKLSRSLAENMRAGSEREGGEAKGSIVDKKRTMDDSWEQQCDDVLSGKMNRNSAMFIAETPNLLAEVGLYDLPMTFTQKHFRAAVDGSNPSHPGKISLADMKELPRLLSQPVAILGSNTNPMGAILVVTTAKDSLNNPVVAAILPEGSAEVDAHKGTTNHILTVYGANHLHTPTTNGGMSTLERAASKGEILYINKKRSQDLYQADGLRLPRALGSLDFDTIIREWNGYVKKNPSAREAKNVFNGDTIQWSVDDGVYAAPMYSKLQREIEAFKGDKIGASSAVSYLRGKGVKAEEIKWSGIETFLEGKKSVGKQELLDWLRENEMTLTAVTKGKTNAQRMSNETGELIETWEDFVNHAYEVAEMYNIDTDNIRYDDWDDSWIAYTYDPETGEEHDIVTVSEVEAEGDDTKWDEYVTGEGANYREILWKMPGSDFSNQAMQVHWGNDEQGVVVHARIDDQQLANGDKVLFIEEIQSDWHNEGAQYGYATKEEVALKNELAQLEYKRGSRDGITFEEMDRIKEIRAILDPERAKLDAELAALRAESTTNPSLIKIEQALVRTGYVSNIHQAEMEIRIPSRVRGILSALDNDNGEVFPEITDADQQALIDYKNRFEAFDDTNAKSDYESKVPDAPYAKTYHEYALKNLLRLAAEEGYDALGWTTAKMQEQRWSEDYAEGYRIEYDQDIPKFLNKYGKQWGAKVGKANLELSDEVSYVNEQIRLCEADKADWEAELENARSQGLDAAVVFVQRQIDHINRELSYLKSRNEVWTIPITKQMRDSVLYEGQPKFSVDDSETALKTEAEDDKVVALNNRINRALQMQEEGLLGSAVYNETGMVFNGYVMRDGMGGPVVWRRGDAKENEQGGRNLGDEQTEPGVARREENAAGRGLSQENLGYDGLGRNQKAAVDRAIADAIGNSTNDETLIFIGNYLDDGIEYDEAISKAAKRVYDDYSLSPVVAEQNWSALFDTGSLFAEFDAAVGGAKYSADDAKLTPEQQRAKDREEAIRRVFRNARDMYGEGDAFVEHISGESQTKAGRDRLMQIFRPQTEQARAEQRTQDDLRRQQERTQRMRDAFGIGAAESGFTQHETPGFAETQSKGVTESTWMDDDTKREAAPAKHQVITEHQSIINAMQGIDLDDKGNITNYDEAVNNLMELDKWTGADGDAAMILMRAATKRGDWDTLRSLAARYNALGTEAGQALQARKKWVAETPEDRLVGIIRAVNRLAEQHNARKGKEIKISDELLREYNNATTEEERDAVITKMQKHVADSIKPTLMDKWTALRYTNMLGNFKTQVRNVLGNASMKALYWAENEVGTLAETLARGRVEKTKSAAVGKKWMRTAKNDYAVVKNELLRGGKYNDSNFEDDFTAAVDKKRRIFSKYNPMEYYRFGTSWAMEKGDLVFSKSAYARSLAGYLKANGFTAEQLDAGTIPDNVLDRAREYAIKRAQEQTFRDSNSFSDWVSGALRHPGTWKPAKIIGEGLMPFRKTPANVMVRAVEFSPIGLLTTAVEAARKSLSTTELANKKGDLGQWLREGQDVTGADIVEQLSKAFTGTALFALGYILSDWGVLRGGGTDDDEAIDELLNEQKWALDIPGYGTYTLDWAAPASLTMFTGANLHELLSDEELTFADFERALTSLTEPMMQMSMLSGINDTIDSIKFSDNNLLQMASTLTVGYLTQGLTNTLLGQVERSIEDVRMKTYTEDSAVPAWLQRAIGKASAKTPGVEYQQAEYLDEFGNTESNGPVWQRLLENFFSPGYYEAGNEGKPAYDFAKWAHDNLGVDAFPDPYVNSSMSHEGETLTLTQEEKERYQITRGSAAESYLEAAAVSEWFTMGTEQGQRKVLEKLMTEANNIAKSELLYERDIEEDISDTTLAVRELDPGQTVAYYTYKVAFDKLKDFEKVDDADVDTFEALMKDFRKLDEEVRNVLLDDGTFEKFREAYSSRVPMEDIVTYYNITRMEDDEGKKLDKSERKAEASKQGVRYFSTLEGIFK